MNNIKIGIDVGNYDAKSEHTSIPSGFTVCNKEPRLADKVLTFDGRFYISNPDTRNPFVIDKTQDDQCLILTLMSMAEEIIYRVKDIGPKKHDDIQKEIDKIDVVNLGIGLPPGHFDKFAKKTVDYYRQRTEDGLSFSYSGYAFNFIIDKISIFPQDFIAVYKNPKSNINKKYRKYYIIGIGGGTVDIIPIVNNKPDATKCISLELGTRLMYQRAIGDVQRETGRLIAESSVEDVLRGNEHILKQDVVEIIERCAEEWTKNIIRECRQVGVETQEYPVVFFGGGCALLKKYIVQTEDLVKYEIIDDVNANAVYYAACL